MLLVAIVAAHIALWISPDVPTEAKRRLTIINASVWAVILLPAIGVGLWLRTMKARNKDR